jgi:cobalt-zinc-cadmium efflux system membrane fusion protein
MNKQTLAVLLSLALSGVSCGGADQQSERSTPGNKGGSRQGGSIDQGRGRGQGVGRGQSQRGVGRGRGQRSYQAEEVRLEPVALTGDELEAMEIETVEASYRPLSEELSAMGKVVAPPRTKAIVSYAFPARISEVHVRLGDWVKKGQKVITLQSEEVGNAKSEFYKSQADYELAKRNYERQKRLLDRGVGARKDFITAEAEHTVAQSSLDAAEKKLHILGFSEEQILEIEDSHQINPIVELYAPITGKIVENTAVLGDMIDQSTEILTIMNSSVLRVDAEIYEKDIAKIRVGQTVEAKVPAYPSQTFLGRIQYVSDIFKEDTRTTTVHAEVDNNDYKLKPGMFADIKINLNHRDEVLALPRSAILHDRDIELVFVRRGDEYVPLIVETGLHESDYVQVVSGLQVGDLVVTNGNFQLKSKMYEDILKQGHTH